jgi:hypothetical protein
MEAIQGFLQEPHDVTSQKTAIFIVTAVKTSNLTTGLGYNVQWFMGTGKTKGNQLLPPSRVLWATKIGRNRETQNFTIKMTRI